MSLRTPHRAAAVAIGVNSVLLVGKGALAAVTGSVALLADAYHSLSDICASVLVFLALRQDARESRPSGPADPSRREARWGKRVAVGIGVLLVVVGVHILYAAGQPGGISSSALPLVIPGVLALAFCSHLLSRFEHSVGERTQTPALVADGRHAQADALTTLLVAISLVGEHFRIAVDRPAAVVIGVLILGNGWQILAEWFRAVAAGAVEQAPGGTPLFEDAAVLWVHRAAKGTGRCCDALLARTPWLGRDPAVARKRLLSLLAGVLAFVLLAGWLRSGIHRVPTDSKAVIERFGRPVNIEEPCGPGLHLRLPWPIEKARVVATERIRSMRVGYDEILDRDYILWTRRHYRTEYSLLCGDRAFVDAAMEVHYRISDVSAYLYGADEPERIAHGLCRQALRECVGVERLFDVLAAGRRPTERAVRERVQTACDHDRLGIEVVSVFLRDIHPPVAVADAFEEVVSSQEDYETYIEEARGYHNDLLPRARGIAAAQLAEASGYLVHRIQVARGETVAFTALAAAVNGAPAIHWFRLRADAVAEAYRGRTLYVVPGGRAGAGGLVVFGRERGPSIGGLAEITREAPKADERPEIRDERDMLDEIMQIRAEGGAP